MLAGVLTVLKIIGIVLLAILAFALLLIFLVLFVPIFYKVEAHMPETEVEDWHSVKVNMDASVRFSWLWFVIRGGIDFPEEDSFFVKVFGIKILPKKEKPSEEEDEEKEASSKEEEDTEKSDIKDSEKTDSSEEKAPTDDDQISESSAEGKEAENEGESDTQENADSFEDKKDDDEEEKSFLDVLWSIFDAIDNFLKTPLNVFEKIQYTISRVCDKIDMIKRTVENDIFKRAFELVKTRLIKIIKMILPDKCDIDILFGSGDPAVTAEFLGAFGALYPILYKKLEFTPDFERAVYKVDADMKGHITIFTIIYSAAVCYFNKDVKKTIRRMKKIINS